MEQNPLTIKTLAERIGVKPQSIRASLCRNGSYFGLQPAKLPNRFFLWPSDAVERVTQAAHTTATNKGGPQ